MLRQLSLKFKVSTRRCKHLIGLHLVGGKPIGEQAHLFLDAVFHFAAAQ